MSETRSDRPRWAIATLQACLCGLAALYFFSCIVAAVGVLLLAAGRLLFAGIWSGGPTTLFLFGFREFAGWLVGLVLSAWLARWSYRQWHSQFLLRAAPVWHRREARAPAPRLPLPATARRASLAVAAAVLVVPMVGVPLLFGQWGPPPPAPGLPFTTEEATELRGTWLPRAEAGDAYAQFVVGQAFVRGLYGVAPDETSAHAWLQKSADQGDPDAVLSVLLQQRFNGLGFRATPDILARLESYVDAQRGWRRVAAEHLMAVLQTDRGIAPSSPYRLRLERAAMEGSRYTAFELARRIERSWVAGDVSQAIGWYAAAGADSDADRLSRTSGQAPAVFAIRRSPPPAADELARLKRRAALVDPHTPQSVSFATDDALVHAVVSGESVCDFESLAGRFAGKDPALARMYLGLATRLREATEAAPPGQPAATVCQALP